MNPKMNEEGEPGSAGESESLEKFVKTYLSAYREYISGKDMDEIHTPQFFKAYPFTADIYALPNGAVCTMFSKASRSKFSLMDGDFDAVVDRVRDQNLDFMAIFPPFTDFTEKEAGRLARMDADRDLKSSRRLEMLTAAEAHISGIHGDIQSVADINPWLDQQAAEQRKKLDRARELILELYNEVDVSREERFSDYMRQLSEVMAFDKGEMEEVAGEVELRLETALEEIESRLSDLEASANNPAKDAGLSEKALEDISELSEEVSEFRDSLSGLSKEVSGIEKEFKSIRTDFSEIRETIQRDSKRAYNLNERVTDLERSAANMKKESGKESTAAVKALEGRLNVMEKEIRGLTKKAVQYDAALARPFVVESPIVETVERTPDGATVKKTVKKTTTTRKTTRSK